MHKPTVLLFQLIQTLAIIAQNEDDHSSSAAAFTIIQVINLEQQDKLETPADFKQQVMLITDCNEYDAKRALNRCATLHNAMTTGSVAFAEQQSTEAHQISFVQFLSDNKFDL